MKKVEKVWGSELWIVNNDLYCGKLLYLKKDYRCSYHYHKLKTESFYLLKGKVKLIINHNDIPFRKGDAVDIFPGMVHSFEGIEDSIIIEISTQHFDSDSYRFDKSRKVKGE